MIPVTSFSGKRVAVFGLGGSGRVTAAALVAGGADVVAFDDKAQSVAEAEAAGIPVADLARADWKKFAALVLSPGVPLTHPEPHWTVRKAAEAGIEVIGDIELFCRERRRNVPNAPFVAITGTNGKSTTTALIAHLLQQAGRDVQLGGNIGRAILSLDPPRVGRYHVIECSSFQIDLAPSINPSVGVLLNVTPDHLDRHGTMERYAAIKERLVTAAVTPVIAVDDDYTQAIADRLERASRRVSRVSARRPLADGIYASASDLVLAENGASKPYASLAGIPSLRGVHNAENAAAAVAVVRRLGLEDDEIRRGLSTFAGLPHRMEEVARRGKVLFINDSKATNADAAAKALASFDRIYWIAGGRPKEGGIASLGDYFPKIAKAYLIGEAANAFADTLGTRVAHEIAVTLPLALASAARDAANDGAGEPVVLLSPACASYDQFPNFERRGDAFRALVLSLDGISRRGEAA
ncbi:MAG: UDP-N-acetylmuramoyl-L-alanine--D-glutamate ligase [Rhizobiales bacterium]|nr:UDP-N-acetylmuramoyl-L-alanine--D-glutamate ligase [Hyphomicrobiales bacterium]